MIVSGTKDFPHDAWDDVSNIPLQTTYNSIRYINADKALTNNDSLCTDDKLTSMVGHSSGGSVVLEMQKQYPDIYVQTSTYRAPLISMTTPDSIDNTSFRTYDDPISMVDRGATMSVNNPLTVQNYLNIKSPSHMLI